MTLAERRLVVITGKGGAGKTTVAAALGSLSATRGRRTIVVECGPHGALSEIFGVRGAPGEEIRVAEGLWSMTLDPERVLIEWLRTRGGRLPALLMESSASVQQLVAAAPGAKELSSIVKVSELTRERRWAGRAAAGYDQVVLDAPASGHALAMLASPRTFAALARVGPLAGRAEAVGELLRGPACAYLAVTHASEMSVTETIELASGLEAELGRDLDAVIVNARLAQRFSAGEMAAIEALPPGDPLLGAARRAARSAHDRARSENAQVARLRRLRRADGAPVPVLSLPFRFEPRLDRAALERIARRLGRHL